MSKARERADAVIGWLGPDRRFPERVALFAAAAAVGPSFEPGLQPRRTVHQAVATGVLAATTLTVVSFAESAIESLGRVVTGDRVDEGSGLARLAITLGSNAAAAAAAVAVAQALPPREDERLRRGLVRTLAERTAHVAVMSTTVASVIGAVDLATERRPGLAWARRVPLSVVAGTAIAAWRISRVRRRARAAGDDTIAGVGAGTSALLGIGVGAGVLGLQSVEQVLARGVASATVAVAPSYEPLAMPIGHLVALGVLGSGVAAAYEYATHRVEQGGAAVEPAYAAAPTSTSVTGGPGSTVAFASLSREGRRFVNMAITADEIEAVMGEPAVAEPVRVFVGLDSAVELEDRVDLVMDELVRTGAFGREVLVLASPTGSGYVNYVLAEAVELLTRGDCAVAAMQYSLLPSFLSLDRTRVATEQNRSLMHAVTGYLRGMPEDRRPRFVLFGESLGAQTMQNLYLHRTVEAMDRDFVHSSLYLGTPAASEFARAWRLAPDRVDPDGRMAEVDHFGELVDLPAARREAVRHVLVSHYDDPIPKFGPALLVREPWWLGPPTHRPPGIPRSTRWRPLTTFLLTGVDLLNSMEVVPGVFGRRGHDYREDIVRFVVDTYDLPADAERLRAVEEHLRERERVWAEKRVVTEQVARAKEAVTRELRSWGVSDPGSDPRFSSLLAGLLDSGTAVASA